jgi:hypothetical protein
METSLHFIESAKELLRRYIKTSKGLVLPREIYNAPTNVKGLEKEIGVVKKEKSKLRHILRHRTRKHTNTTRPVGKRGNIHGKRADNNISTDTRGQKRVFEGELYTKNLFI